jgi:hypothetical protein
VEEAPHLKRAVRLEREQLERPERAEPQARAGRRVQAATPAQMEPAEWAAQTQRTAGEEGPVSEAVSAVAAGQESIRVGAAAPQ